MPGAFPRPSRTFRALRAGVAALAMACAGACAPARPDPALILDAPPDFSIAVTVLPGDAPSDSIPRALRPARYLVEPDGVLRVSTQPASRAWSYPPATRQLTGREMDRLWRLVGPAGLLDPATPARLTRAEGADAPGPVAVAIIFAQFAGRREAYRTVLARADAQQVLAERLVDHLADLAWIPPP
jgi:hypothetical protein